MVPYHTIPNFHSEHRWSTDDEELFRWENGVFNSLVPPRFGWERIDDNGNGNYNY